MATAQAQRTLVKSLPELWEELSDAETLAGHLEAFGEIRIARLEKERAVAWEGDEVSGRVELEASGFGTKVTLTAVAATEPEEEPVRPPPPEPPAPTWAPAAWVEQAHPRPSLWHRVFGYRPEPELIRPELAPPEPEPSAADGEHEEALTAVLDALGAAHHRPFSRG